MNSIKILHGHSGNEVVLINDSFVRKFGNVDRNIERLQYLHSKNYPVSSILSISDNYIDLEYIQGIECKEYLKNYVAQFIEFSIETLNRLSKNSVDKNYKESLVPVISWVTNNDDFPFSCQDLLDTIPDKLPCSDYHGDFTLDNIIYSNNSFVLIDAVTTPYDSFIFDIAKLRQDLECKWFLRNSNLDYNIQLQQMQTEILNQFPLASNNTFLILMLLRIYLHTKPDTFDRDFIVREINQLWIL